MRCQRAVFALAAFVLVVLTAQQFSSAQTKARPESEARRKRYLEQLRRLLPPSPPWEERLERTGELPPDFDSMPSCAELPDPLVRWVDGREVPVKNREEWRERRDELKRQLQYWILGSTPPAPERIEAEVIREVDTGSAIDREVILRFGPRGRARLWLELMIPKGEGPFSIFMTQHNHRAWALIALRRGYLACVHAGSDSRDDTDTFLDEYPDYDWSRLTRRAWAASRCIDYLATLPEADTSRIALTGHSRNGKQSLIAAALDERIDVVISSSSGAGGSLTARYFSEQHFGEGIELITRHFPDWFHPRWRFFVGREHKLPVDLHDLVALIAPRACLLSTALNDPVESVWGIERTYLAAKRVYDFLGAGDKIRILWREGSHETCPWVIDRYLDWCDLQFGRGEYTFVEEFPYPARWEAWRESSGIELNPADFPVRGPADFLSAKGGRRIKSLDEWRARKREIRRAVSAMLGEAPPRSYNRGGTYGSEPYHVAALLRRSSLPVRQGLDTWLLGHRDVLMPAAFVKRLRSGATPLSRYIWGKIPVDVRGRLAEGRPGDERTLQRIFAQQLNRLLLEDSLWVHVGDTPDLPAESFRRFVAAARDMPGRARANRIVLEATFPRFVGRALAKHQIVFGEYINGDLVYPAAAEALGQRLPAILWLHPISQATGYVAGYMRGEQPFQRLAQAGFAVFCYDQVGNGRRIREAQFFYERHPRWSLLGKMVRDARAALDVLGRFEVVDTSRVWVVGYATGALLALHLGAFEDRPCGWVLVCPPPPFRLDRDVKETGGIARWSQRTMLLPVLGLFVGQEERLPYDVPELLACLAPKPTLVVSPKLDREAPVRQVTKAVDLARDVYRLWGAEDALVQLTPEDYNHFGSRMQEIVVRWLLDQERR